MNRNQHLRPALQHRIPCMAHALQLALCAFPSSHSEKRPTNSWEEHEHDQQFGENKSIDIGKSDTLRKEGNSRIDKVSAMRPGLAKMNEQVRISRYLVRPKNNLPIAANACCIDTAETWLSKEVDRLSNCQSSLRGTAYYGFDDTFKFDSGVAWVSRPITRIHPRVPPESKLHWIPATLHNTGWMDLVRYIMEVLRPFEYGTLWMLKRHTVTVHHVITVYCHMMDHTDGILWALATKKTPWMEDLYFAVKLAWQKLSRYYTELTPTMGMLLISAHILDPFSKLRSFRMSDKEMDIITVDETLYTSQYQHTFLKYVEDSYSAKHRCMLDIKSERVTRNNIFPSAMTSGYGRSSFDRYYLSSDAEKYLLWDNVAETTPGWSERAACLLTAWITKERGASQSKSPWLPCWAKGD